MLTCTAIVVAALSPMAQSILIVDPSGAPGADCTTLAAAVQAAGGGDTLLLREGQYGALEISGKSLFVQAENPDLTFVERVFVAGTGTDQPVSVRGLTLFSADPVDHGLLVQDCAGAVHLEDITMVVATGTNMRVENSASVVVNRSSLLANNPTSGYAIELVNSATYVFDSTIPRGDFVAAIHVFGGELGIYETEFPACSSVYCNPGASLVIAGGAAVEIQGTQPPNVVIQSGTLDRLVTPTRTHEASSPVYEGEDIELRFEGEPGDLVFAVLSTSAAYATSYPKVDVPLLLGGALATKFIGVIPGSGELALTSPIGELGPNVAGLTFFVQPVFLVKPGSVFSEPTAVTLLDASLRRPEYLYSKTPAGTRTVEDNVAFGAWISSAGDVNGDGYEDVIIGDPGHEFTRVIAPYYFRGAAYVYHGNHGGGLSATPDWVGLGTKTIRSYGPTAFGAFVAAAGDVNGDGYDDVLITAITGGQLFVFYGSAAGVQTAGHSVIEDFPSPWRFQGQAAAVGDANGDGFDDILLLAECWGTACEVGGKNRFARLHLGSATGLVTGAPVWEAPAVATYAVSVGPAGDVNGDGLGDFLVGGAELGGDNSISLYLGGTSAPSLAWTYIGNGYLGLHDFRGVGDANGDGFGDLAFANGQSEILFFAGAAAGPSPSPEVIRTPLFNTQGGLRALGDVDGDGFDDVMFQSNTPGFDWFLLRGSAQGLRETAAWKHPAGAYSSNVAGVPDINGDGRVELLVSDYDGYLPDGANPGSVFLFPSLP